MEPWYNLNRPDQIVGRGVRTFSHLSLPFPKRNVQIFFHGTLLNIMKNNEAVDLYIYRKAEEKAIKIGKITRILKENSIDSILNVEQNSFTEEMMNMEVKQTLSTEKILLIKLVINLTQQCVIIWKSVNIYHLKLLKNIVIFCQMVKLMIQHLMIIL